MAFIRINVGKMVQGPTFIPATPYGIMLCLNITKLKQRANMR